MLLSSVIKPLYGVLESILLNHTSRQHTKEDWRVCQEEHTENTKAVVSMPRPLGETPTAERAKEWLHCVEIGRKELIHSLEDNHELQTFRFCGYYSSPFDILAHREHALAVLYEATETVKSARTIKGLSHIDSHNFIIKSAF